MLGKTLINSILRDVIKGCFKLLFVPDESISDKNNTGYFIVGLSQYLPVPRLSLKGPKGEAVGSITQPLPSSYLIIRATSESDGKYFLMDWL